MRTPGPRSETQDLGIRRAVPDNAAMEVWRVKAVLNVVNLSTPVGLAVALGGRARIRRGPRGLLIASDFRLGSGGPWSARAHADPPDPRIPPAFTVGNVVITPRPAEYLDRRPALLAHE